MKRLLLFATKIKVLRQARALGFSVVNFDKVERVNDERRANADVAVAIDWDDPKDYLTKAMRLHLESPIDATLAFGEYTVYPAALVREHLGVIGNPLAPVFTANEKPLLRALLRSRSDFAVRFQRLERRVPATEIVGGPSGVGLPLILKPSNSSGSAGVALCRDIASVERYLEQYEFASPLLAEEFLDGPEISVEALSAFGVHTVLAITAKETTGSPRFIETGHRQPAALDAATVAEVEKVVTSMLSLIGHDLGPSHTELRLTDRGPRIIETHTRPGGDGIADLTELTTGIDVFFETLKVVKSICDLGYEGARAAYKPPAVARKVYASSQFFLWSAGEVTAVNGVAEAQHAPGVVELEVKAKTGDFLPEPVDSHSRHGHFVVCAESPEELGDRIVRIREMVSISVKP